MVAVQNLGGDVVAMVDSGTTSVGVFKREIYRTEQGEIVPPGLLALIDDTGRELDDDEVFEEDEHFLVMLSNLR